MIGPVANAAPADVDRLNCGGEPTHRPEIDTWYQFTCNSGAWACDFVLDVCPV
jgi:hypothetical protein